MNFRSSQSEREKGKWQSFQNVHQDIKWLVLNICNSCQLHSRVAKDSLSTPTVTKKQVQRSNRVTKESCKSEWTGAGCWNSTTLSNSLEGSSSTCDKASPLPLGYKLGPWSVEPGSPSVAQTGLELPIKTRQVLNFPSPCLIPPEC